MKRKKLTLTNSRHNTEVILYPHVFETIDRRTFYRLSNEQIRRCSKLTVGHLALNAPAEVGTGALGEYPERVIFEGHHPLSLQLTDEQKKKLSRLDEKRDAKGWEYTDGFYFQLKG